MTTTDLLGRPLDPDEVELLELYQRTKAFLARDGLAPCVQANARGALVALWNAVNDLALTREPLPGSQESD